MNPLAVLLLAVFVTATVALVVRSHSADPEHGMPLRPVIGILVGVVTGFVVVSLNGNVVPDELEWIGLFGLAVGAFLSTGLLVYRLVRE